MYVNRSRRVYHPYCRGSLHVCVVLKRCRTRHFSPFHSAQLQRNRVKKIESRRLNDGKLTIVFQEPSKFDMISISGVGEIMALQHCVRFLEQLTRTPTLSAPLNASRYAPLSLEQTPPSHSQLNGGKPFFSASKRCFAVWSLAQR